MPKVIVLKYISWELSIKHQLLPRFCQNFLEFPGYEFVFSKSTSMQTQHHNPGITTRKFTSSLKMPKQKSVENQKDGKRGKIMSFLIPKERTEIGTLPRPVRLAVRSCNVKLVGLFEVVSKHVTTLIGLETRHSRKMTVDIHEFALYSLSLKSKHTTKKWRPSSFGFWA